ncbi:GTPase [Allobranchiibius sp. CTAmp26]|uniref:GTPase n=1 Tax=Allobranchiibius sp. CTAmp26 TaxID=2815214 RepID=UPI001AA0C77F|nr:GTPase [Allobranchiibius sp. CTAmp26]MBO1755989.1 50S ribosome-binding GTPase [Allobranchiibius sp. CTAmp26]
MTPILGRHKAAAPVPAEQLAQCSEDLTAALDHGGSRLPAHDVAQARALLDKARARTALTGSRTVVALAGATGSGKSTLFNALVGEPISRIGARRPTTSSPAAAIWGDEPSADLLDWLGVSTRHQVAATSLRSAELDGMVLLDLPDFDSTIAQHRAEADRVLELADVFVWVTDPQKYADAVMHDEYISRSAGHDAVTLVVLNQVDLLQRAQVGECVADLQRLLVADGLGDVRIIPTSAARGHGVDDVVSAVAQVVQQHNAAERRLLGDLTVRATGLRTHVGDSEPPVQDAGPELDRALAQAAGVPVVLDAVERDYLMRSTQHGGWPFTRWITKLRPAPLSRLGLDKVVSGGLSRHESSTVLGRSSLPPPTPASRAAVDVASRELAERACAGLPQPWADAVQDAAAPNEKLYDELDRAVMGVPLRGRNPGWWSVVAVLQWLFAIVAVLGLLWLVSLTVLSFGQVHLDPPTVGIIPIPLLMLVLGLLAGLALAVLSKWIARRGAARRSRAVGARMRQEISGVAARQITDPVAVVLSDHRQTRVHLEAAAG